MTHDLDKYYKTCMNLVTAGSEVILEAFSKRKKVDTKTNDIDLVTETDLAVESLLINGLKRAFPDHKFIGEESVSTGSKCILGDDPTWIIDPIDGTMNFVHSFPMSAISIGLLINKTPVIAIICNPMLKLTYTARKGQGAYLNGKRITVSGQTELKKALVGIECARSGEAWFKLQNFKAVLEKCQGTRALGSAAMEMANVAAGGLDAYFQYGLHAWDMAAGELLIQEAGGVVMDPDGGNFDVLNRRVLCAASEQLAKEISVLLDHIQLERD